MKHLLIIFTIFYLFGCQQAEEKGFTLTGSIEGLESPYVYIKYNVNEEEFADSAVVENGSFHFSGKVDEPSMAIIYSPQARFQKVFYLDNADMQLKGSSGALDSLKVTGSEIQADFNILENRISNNRREAINFYNQFEKAKEAGDSANMKILYDKFDELYKKEPSIRKGFVIDYPNSIVSLNEMMNFVNATNYEEGESIFEKFSDEIKSSKRGKEVAEFIYNLSLAQTGKTAIDFSQPDVDGNPVSLANYKGKYVLLEFWASWCGPCRYENPNLRRDYKLYNDKGFDILGISLDENREKWLKAIEKDSLPWVHVSDLKGWKNEIAVKYGIRGIPANFLVDPNGKIIERDLRGDKLHEKLAELFD